MAPPNQAICLLLSSQPWNQVIQSNQSLETITATLATKWPELDPVRFEPTSFTTALNKLTKICPQLELGRLTNTFTPIMRRLERMSPKAIEKYVRNLFEQAYHFEPAPKLTMGVVNPAMKAQLDWVHTFLMHAASKNIPFYEKLLHNSFLDSYFSLNSDKLSDESRCYIYALLTTKDKTELDQIQSVFWQRKFAELEKMQGEYYSFDDPIYDEAIARSWTTTTLLGDQVSQIQQKSFPTELVQQWLQAKPTRQKIYQYFAQKEEKVLLSQIFAYANAEYLPVCSEAERLQIREVSMILTLLSIQRGIADQNFFQAYFDEIGSQIGMDAETMNKLIITGPLSQDASRFNDLLVQRYFLEMFSKTYQRFLKQSPQERMTAPNLAMMNRMTDFLLNQETTLLNYADFKASKLRVDAANTVQYPAINSLGDIDSLVDKHQVIALSGKQILPFIPDMKPDGFSTPLKSFILDNLQTIHVTPISAPVLQEHQALGMAYGNFLTTLVASPRDFTNEILFVSALIHEAAHNHYFIENYPHPQRLIMLSANERYAQAMERSFLLQYLALNKATLSPAELKAIRQQVAHAEYFIQNVNVSLDLSCDDYSPYLHHTSFDPTRAGVYGQSYQTSNQLTPEQEESITLHLAPEERQKLFMAGYMLNYGIPAGSTELLRDDVEKLDQFGPAELILNTDSYPQLKILLDEGGILTGGMWQRVKQTLIASAHLTKLLGNRANRVLAQRLQTWLSNQTKTAQEILTTSYANILYKRKITEVYRLDHPFVLFLKNQEELATAFNNQSEFSHEQILDLVNLLKQALAQNNWFCPLQ